MTESINSKTMKIVNIHTGKHEWINYETWKSEYLNKHIAANYKILTMPNLVDVFKVKPNGGHEYIATTDRNIAIKDYVNKDKLIIIKKADINRFDKKQCRELTNPYTDKNANEIKKAIEINSTKFYYLRRFFLNLSTIKGKKIQKKNRRK
jgi:hypothetical protein